jgi:hypothetical protein
MYHGALELWDIVRNRSIICHDNDKLLYVTYYLTAQRDGFHNSHSTMRNLWLREAMKLT